MHTAYPLSVSPALSRLTVPSRVCVLTKHVWSTRKPPALLGIRAEFQEALDCFQTFFCNKDRHKCLAWQYQLFDGEVCFNLAKRVPLTVRTILSVRPCSLRSPPSPLPAHLLFCPSFHSFSRYIHRYLFYSTSIHILFSLFIYQHSFLILSHSIHIHFPMFSRFIHVSFRSLLPSLTRSFIPVSLRHAHTLAADTRHPHHAATLSQRKRHA